MSEELHINWKLRSIETREHFKHLWLLWLLFWKNIAILKKLQLKMSNFLISNLARCSKIFKFCTKVRILRKNCIFPISFPYISFFRFPFRPFPYIFVWRGHMFRNCGQFQYIGGTEKALYKLGPIRQLADQIRQFQTFYLKFVASKLKTFRL